MKKLYARNEYEWLTPGDYSDYEFRLDMGLVHARHRGGNGGWFLIGALGEYSEKAADKADHVIKTYEATNLKGLEEAEVPDM
jgi:hypothetical protein